MFKAQNTDISYQHLIVLMIGKEYWKLVRLHFSLLQLQISTWRWVTKRVSVVRIKSVQALLISFWKEKGCCTVHVVWSCPTWRTKPSEIPLFERHMPCGSPWRGQLSLPKIGLHWKSSGLLSPWMLLCDCTEDIYNKKKMALFPSLISSSQSNTKLTLIENKKEKVLKQSWSLWLRFRAQGNLKDWNVELERIWCVSNWTEGDTVSGVCTFRHYLSNVLWHVWSIGRQGHRNEGFMQTPLQFYLSSSVWVHAPLSKKTSRHTSRFRSYRVCVWAIWVFTLNNI